VHLILGHLKWGPSCIGQSLNPGRLTSCHSPKQADPIREHTTWVIKWQPHSSIYPQPQKECGTKACKGSFLLTKALSQHVHSPHDPEPSTKSQGFFPTHSCPIKHTSALNLSPLPSCHNGFHSTILIRSPYHSQRVVQQTQDQQRIRSVTFDN